MALIALTTEDNPFDPFKQFDQWYAFDEGKGYHTMEYLARIAKVSNDMTDEDMNYEIDEAIKEIAKFNLTGNYKIVTEEE